MITFQIVDSPDKEIMGTHTYSLNELILGSSSGDLLINDPEWSNIVFFIYFNNKKLLIRKSDKISSFHFNGKKTVSEALLKKNDIIAFGRTQIMIVDFQEEVLLEKKKIIEQGMEKILTDPSLESARELFDILEIELENLNVHRRR